MTENPPLLRKPDLLPSLPNKSWGLQVKKKKERNGGRGGGYCPYVRSPLLFLTELILSSHRELLLVSPPEECGRTVLGPNGRSVFRWAPNSPVRRERVTCCRCGRKKTRLRLLKKKNEGWKSDAKIKDTEQVHLFLSLTVLFLLYQDATAVLFPSKDPRKHTTELYYRCKQFKQPVSLGLQDSFRQPSFTVSTLPTRLSPFSLSPPSPPLSVW